jgi:2-polyprenyl-6-methoxyphenol hydroxylase-like FAD-dependent oxidoreductase
MSPEDLQYDVAIVGYGPGAQCLAALLARAGRRVAAFERYPHMYNLPRAGHIDHETVRLVQSVGNVQEFVKTLWEVRDDYVWINGQGQLLMLQPAHDAGESVSGWYSDYTQWQPNLEHAFDEAARAGGAEISLGWEAIGLEQDSNGVTLTVARTKLQADGRPTTTAEQRVVRARYVVGADGANSFVRATLNIDCEDIGSGERWLDVDMATLRPLEFHPNIGQICDPARPRMLMPLGKSHRRFEWMVLPHESTAEMERPEIAWALLKEYGVTPENHQIARQIVYTFQARMATRWRIGRTFLAGDAAHTMPPYAGQGLLSALRDASNLSWKLHLVLGGQAPDRILETYESERRPHVSAWTQVALAEGRVSCELDPVRAAERDARMIAGEKLEVPHAPSLGHGVFQAGRAGNNGIVGTLGLQARVRTTSGTGRFDDLLGARQFSVLTTGAHPREILSAAQVARLEQLGAILVEVIPADRQPTAGAIVDIDGRYQQYLAQHGVAAIVNRPDYYVFGAVAKLAQLPHLVEELETCLARGAADV